MSRYIYYRILTLFSLVQVVEKCVKLKKNILEMQIKVIHNTKE